MWLFHKNCGTVTKFKKRITAAGMKYMRITAGYT
jgi:hypothetical protein